MFICNDKYKPSLIQESCLFLSKKNIVNKFQLILFLLIYILKKCDTSKWFGSDCYYDLGIAVNVCKACILHKLNTYYDAKGF